MSENSTHNNSRKRIREIFFEAYKKKTPKERSQYLDKVCGSDLGLRRELVSLLEAHDRSGGLLENLPVVDNVTPDDIHLSEKPGTVIDKYKLLEKIGEGGMAVVYMAEQTKPICRKVALKIIKLGMDTKQVIARFEAERQALAIMDHPNIARVLDAGATETGRPYFVMELVQGVSITEYCDKNNLSTKERLELFIQVCNAVQHAHQKGIIHRDIKPTNVMITYHDGKPIPKVIDFGIAKAINQKLTEKTLFTRYAHIIGTPAYMSPEQAELSDLDIDTRSDIYSLGVLLYELLTGTPPFSEEELRKAGYIEMQRVIREQEPVKPSTKLSTLGQTLTDVAKHHSATPDVLRKAVRGDLDWIVMKSLEKDRSRRYETASMLGQDIRHHLDHEPVLARGPSTTYRLQKFLRRHRSETVAALSLLVIAGGVTLILSMWNRDRLQLLEAEGFRHRGILSQAREQYVRADREAATETIKPVLDSMHVGPEARLLYAGILVDNRKFDEAASILKNLVNDRPEIAGATHSLLARILWERGSMIAEQLKEIDEHRRKAETLLPETAEAYFLRAMTAITIKEQLASLDKALQLDPGHYESRRLQAYTYYASRKYDRMKEDALAMEILRPRDPLGYSLRAIAWRGLEKYAEAIAEYDNAIALTLKGNPQYIDLSTQRCEILLRMGDYKRVITDAQECLKISPDEHVFQYHLFSALTALGEYEKADAVFRQIAKRTPTARNEFWFWATKYVFDTLAAGQSWHPPGHEPTGAAFLPLVEAEETYRALSAKAHRVVTNGFSAQWSPDGKKLAFSLGVQGNSGVALYDPATKQTELLIVPGKDPRWSPDGQYLAFVRDCQALRLEELTSAERKDQQRGLTDEEVWVMKSDGTEPRRLARGGWPSWNRDSTQVYYHSRLEKMLYSISTARSNAEPKRIMACPSEFPSVSPDEQQVAYLENKSLKVKDLVSQAVVAQWHVSFDTWVGPAWSPTGKEVCLGAAGSVGDRTGLWIYPLDSNEPIKVLTSQIMAASWAPDSTKLVFALRPPYFELWTDDLDPALSTVKALGPGQTLAEHWQDMLRLYTRRIQADPQDAYAYYDRARYCDYLHDRAKAEADMERWSAIMSGRSVSDLQFDKSGPRRFASRNETAWGRHVINMPFNCQVVFSAERPVNKIPVLNIAFGQKGRCSMKLFQIPILATRSLAMSLLGLCLFSGLDAPPARADFTFGDLVDIQSTFPINPATEYVTSFSADGLEVYFVPSAAPLRSGGQGGADIWVLTRATVGDDWGPPENLGPNVNTASNDWGVSITVDDLELYFYSNRPGGYGGADIYMTRRATRTSPWGPATNLGQKVNGSFADSWPIVSPDGLELYVCSDRPGGMGSGDIYVSKRVTTQDPWGDPENLGPAVNSPGGEGITRLSPDGLLLFFSSDRPGGFGKYGDGYVARRASCSAPWQPAVNLGPIVNATTFNWPIVSPDGSTLYILADPNDDMSTWTYKAPILPVVDFNADEIVDLSDLVLLIDNWGTDNTLYDIGPYAWGDGVVDIEDLKVFIEYWEKENTPEITEEIQ
jgi:serine/threonine protein kinase/Tol biopolymer transport system component/tetratricopeptide (TPR) repeat protein